MAAVTPALAQPDESRLWSGQVEFGATSTSGNTNSDNFNGRFEVLRSAKPWRNLVRLDGLYSKDSGNASSQRITAFTQQDYSFNDTDYAFHKLRYERDRFNGFEYEASTSVGYGRRLLAGERHRLDLELGAGYRQSKSEDTGNTDDEGLLLVGGDYRWKISEGATFVQEVSSEIGNDKTVSRSVSKLTTAINSRLNLNASFEARHTSSVSPGRKRTDTITALTLGYRF